MIQKLHKTEIISDLNEPKNGERKVLCSYETNSRSPFLDSTQPRSDEFLMEYLADLLIEIYMSEGYDH